MKIRMFEIVQDTDKIDMEKVVHWLGKNDCNYIVGLHDKDNTRPHYHIEVQLKGAREIEDIAKQCGVAPQYIEKSKTGHFKDMVRYVFHKNNPDKFQYDETAVKFCNFAYQDLLCSPDVNKCKDPRENEIREILYDYGRHKLTRKEVNAVLTPEEYHKYKRLYDDMKTLRNEPTGEEREMNVIYITGSKGSGKTTFAKYLAKKMGYDYFTSGSGADPLDGYDGERCVILDDLRADVFTKAELFKLTDNNTESSVKSRYFNKALRRCKLLIISSVKAPVQLYDWREEAEPAGQFARRLNYGCYHMGDDGSIEMWCLDDMLCNTDRTKTTLTIDMVFKYLGIDRNKPKLDLLKLANDFANEPEMENVDPNEVPF